MHFKTVDQQNLFYELIGNKNSDKYLIFLNGISQSTSVWNLMVPSFQNDYRIILCDFIFQGQSDKQGEFRDFDQHAADIYGLIDFLDIQKISLVGISYGSLVAQHFVLNYPAKVDKLVLLSTFAHKTAYYDAIELAWQRTLDSGGYGLLMEVMNRQMMNQDPEALKKLMKATKQRADYREKLKAVKRPTLIIHGEKDLLLLEHMGKAVADSIQGSTFEVIPGAGHTLNLEAVSPTIKLMNDFFAE